MTDVPIPEGRLRLAIVGSLVGRNRGLITTQGEVLGDVLAAAGCEVVFTSSRRNRAARLGAIAATLVARRKSYEAVLVQTYSGPSFLIADLASLVAGALRKPVLFHLHGGELPEFLSRYPRWGRRVLSRGKLLVAPSGFLSRAVAPLGLAVDVIPNVVDVRRYPYRHRAGGEPRLFWMRSFHALYRPEMALHVLARVRETRPDATLVMAGPDKGEEPAVRRLAVELGLGGAVRFAGFLDPAGKSREGNAAEIFLNTNRVDNQPVSVLEACAMGLPVVATAVGGVPDLLTHEESGLLVPDGDDGAMAAAVLRLLAEPALAARLSRAGRALAERCSPENVLPLWREAFRKADAPASPEEPGAGRG